jgi:CubicO group peptidase (beta-lactamase class C family)
MAWSEVFINASKPKHGMNNNTIKPALLFLCLCIQVIAGCAQPNKTYAKETESKISQVESNLAGWVQIDNSPVGWKLADRMKFYHANGVSIAVIKDYKIEWAKGYGWADSAEQRPVTTLTLFQAGSNSKSLNAVGILKLAQEGKLDLYTDINTYLKSWKFPYDSLSKGKKITIANLLSHTGGLTVHGFPGYEKGDTIPTLVQVLNGQKPANTNAIRSMYEPSLKSEYSGGGTTISQLIVQDVTGQPYDVYMWENVLKPLGMVYSSYTQPPSADKQNLLATGYYNDGKAVKGKYHIYPEQAAAGLWTNATDLANYVIETQLSLMGKSQKVLSQKMTVLRLTPYIDSSAALGIFIFNKAGVKYFRHGGVDEGFVSQYTGSFEGGNGVVVMTNTYNTALFEEIINSVAKTYQWKNYYTPEIKKVTALPENLLQFYTGKYKIDNDTLTVLRRNDGVYLDVGNATQWKMYFTDNIHFFVFEQKIDFNFVSDATNIVTGFMVNKQLATKIK